MPEWLEDFIGYLWLIIFPEAFINGMVVSALVVFCPEWLETFNRTRYLRQHPWNDDVIHAKPQEPARRVGEAGDAAMDVREVGFIRRSARYQ
jgi:hypothetical protein